jgi:hypothetical protein
MKYETDAPSTENTYSPWNNNNKSMYNLFNEVYAMNMKRNE